MDQKFCLMTSFNRHTNTVYVLCYAKISEQFAKYREKALCILWTSNGQIAFSFRGGALPPDQGLCSRTPLGLSSSFPIIDLHSVLVIFCQLSITTFTTVVCMIAIYIIPCLNKCFSV